MASIKQQDDGQWVVRWGEMVDGKRKQRWQTEPDEQVARELKAQIETLEAQRRALARTHGIEPDKTQLIDGTIRDVGDAWLAQLANRGTREGNRGRIRNHIYPHVGDLRLSQLRPLNIKDLERTWTRVPLAPATRLQLFANLKAIYSWAVVNRFLDRYENPFDTVRTPRLPDSPVVDAWPDSWIEGMASGIRENLSIFPLMGAWCGLRQGEIFGLSPQDFVTNKRGQKVVQVNRQVKQVSGHLFFAPPKHRKAGDQPREIPVPGFVWDAVRVYQGTYAPRPVTLEFDAGDDTPLAPVTHSLLITSREGNAMNRNYFNPFIWKPVLRGLGIPQTRVNGTHALRHWFACTALENGTSLARLSELLGHKDRAFTLKVYGRFQPDKEADLADAMDVIGRRMFRNGGQL
jgi:integrase